MQISLLHVDLILNDDFANIMMRVLYTMFNHVADGNNVSHANTY
ncbi:hypothetical protein [Helicobacter bilis]|nr:hypothetical protein [Helicobacter bilis]